MEYVTTNGVIVPALGFGTARMDEYETQRLAIETALATGYRHLDTAQIYGSERAVGDAIRESSVDRADCFITTKLSGDNRSYDRVLESTQTSLDRLDTDYVDLLLIHSPNEAVAHAETLEAMNELYADGAVRHLGVSNFSIDQCEQAREASEAPIITNQVKYHLRHRQDELLTWCLEEDIILTAYSPLAVGGLTTDSTLQEIGQAHGKTAAQVAIRWLLDQPNVMTIPMSSSPAHIRENFDVFDFSLCADERRRLFGLEGSPPSELLERFHE